MSVITLKTEQERFETPVPNQFIDRYLPGANGEFVKVYLSLLRFSLPGDRKLELSAMADFLLCTERDILRALKYWEKEGLLSLSFSEEKTLERITLLGAEGQKIRIAEEKSPRDEKPSEKDRPGDAYPGKRNTKTESLNVDAPPGAKLSGEGLTAERIEKLQEDEAIDQLLYIAEQYLKKPLSPTEMRKILSFYDELQMSPELIEYLIEYCVGRNHKSIRYMETVALAWKEEGITTARMAKESAGRFRKEHYAILKAMGISGRHPIDEEVAYMDRWMQEFGFDLRIIQEACSRTILKIGQPSFQYAEGILSDWKNSGVHLLKDIRALDEQYRNRKKETGNAVRAASHGGSTKNQFTDFSQREYDFDDYEKRLLSGQAEGEE